MNLNKEAKNALYFGKIREKNGARIDCTTIGTLKHCAGELVEAIEAHMKYLVAESTENKDKIDISGINMQLIDKEELVGWVKEDLPELCKHEQFAQKLREHTNEI